MFQGTTGKRLFLAGCLSLIATTIGNREAFGQTLGSIAGQARDASGGAISETRVTATNTGSNAQRTAVTNDAGEYAFPSLPPGVYNLKAEKPGFKTVTSQIYSPDDPHLETDSQFGVTRALVAQYVVHENDGAPSQEVTGPWYSLQHTFVLQPGECWLPTPPVSKKAAQRLQNP